jgi:RecA/RadA recombinase
VEREQSLDAALSQIERQYGKGAVMKMGDQAQVAIPSISTGSLSLDAAASSRSSARSPRERRRWSTT